MIENILMLAAREGIWLPLKPNDDPDVWFVDRTIENTDFHADDTGNRIRFVFWFDS